MKKIISAICIMVMLIGMTSPVLAAAKDTKAPTITKTSPGDKATDIMIESEIVVRFSENVKKAKAIDNISITSVLGKTIDFTYEIKNNLLVITPKSKLAYLMDYTVVIPAGTVKDSAGNTFKKEITFNFVTEEDPKAQTNMITDGITYEIGLEATLQGEFTPAMQLYLVEYLKMLGIEAKITDVKKAK
jgi:hypothetical protein